MFLCGLSALLGQVTCCYPGVTHRVNSSANSSQGRGLTRCQPEVALSLPLLPGQDGITGLRLALGAQKGQELRPYTSLPSLRKGTFGAFVHPGYARIFAPVQSRHPTRGQGKFPLGPELPLDCR